MANSKSQGAFREYATVDTQPDSNGYKLGPLYNNEVKSDSLKRFVYNNLSFENTAHGFNQNLAKCKFAVYNNVAYNNDGGGYTLQYDANAVHIVRNNIAYSNGLNMIYLNSVSTVDNNNFNYNNTVNSSYTISDADFVSVSSTGVDGERQANGNLPVLTFLKLVAGSDLIDTGVDVGLNYIGTYPDLGAYEFGEGVPPAVPSGNSVKQNGKFIRHFGKVIKVN